MRIPGWMAAAALATLASVTASGTTFIVPEDEEMIDKATAIVIGTVEGSYVQERDNVETVYELRVERSLKGGVKRDELLRIVSPGGALDGRGTIVPGSAHFVNGERVLLFLTFESQKWQVTDMILGKFHFAQTPEGEHLLQRDHDVPRERLRREDGFLRFIETRAAGKRGMMPTYFRADDTTDSETERSPFSAVLVNAPFRAYTYTDNVKDSLSPAYLPTRWANIAAGVPFYKVVSQNISGAADGGVSVIQNGLAAWNNECGSVINLVYGGTTSTGSADLDNISVVEFNDPKNRIAGSWTGSGTVATTFLSYNDQHGFDSMQWWSIGDADVVFQNGYTAGNASFPTAMTHEIGHGIGWRHANAHYIRNADFTDAPCNAGVEECSSSAIMYSSAISSLGYTLQTWDVNAAQSTYPGGSCGGGCTAPAITGQPTSRTITSGQSTTLTVTATGTSLSYQWYQGTAPNTGSPAGTGPSLTVAPSATTSYWVRVSNACGTVNSSTATVTVTAPPPATATRFFTVTPCRAADTRNGGPVPGEVAFQITGRCGIPSTAKAVSLNVTVVSPPANGFMTVYPTGTPRPGTSTISYAANKTRANNAILLLPANGQLTVFNFNGVGATHVLLDVNGYFQ